MERYFSWHKRPVISAHRLSCSLTLSAIYLVKSELNYAMRKLFNTRLPFSRCYNDERVFYEDRHKTLDTLLGEVGFSHG